MIVNLSKLFQFVVAVSSKYNIDESHSLGHSMRVLHFAEQIANQEMSVMETPHLLEKQKPIIHAAAILHDTCDKKYRVESEGVAEIRNLLLPMMPTDQIEATVRIIEHMSYSKVTKYGMPNMGEYQTAFNVVREADLLDAYDFDRSVIYHFEKNQQTIENSYENAVELFEKRVLRHMDDGFLLTNYAKKMHPEFSQKALIRMTHWKNILKQSPYYIT
jgi:HD superfamily phosphodiesterase